ncbi:MAG: metalloregulator ArsR/SmtB family transcription factor [Oscillospiraceae bacterium]|nr:metalloregulator ArsR/SmtB family transcription factor [Oscillospiraceae bacterium]MBQ2795107.1 metalloregulator ArsR/SmtB family transcription factor [Oscillospiraceae bacterium]MBQ3235963.1 metalloregulator ArsR/SmtB family transcription factor [Oscillospiraceae bacterium]MBQ3561051.1 metalloregulator ArsR/SmtB family transcription factor [Oscillospiraceae bacterium]MBQ4118638.1 metalloregulator ArsR/SmtB family transcription factor [Oscillospiraceae bacterium]
MNEEAALKLFKCLGDKSRFGILKSLAKEDMYVELLAERLGLTAATVSFHLKKLEDAGAVSSYKEQYYTIYTINKNIFMTSILDIIFRAGEEENEQQKREDAYRKKVLESFFEYGRLKSIPAQRKKEKIILEEIAKDFEKEKEYPEQEVNDIIMKYHDDYCTIRRDMIAEGIMERNGNTYIKK